MKKALYIVLAVSIIANTVLGISLYKGSKNENKLEKQLELEKKQFEKKRRDGETLDINELSSEGKEKLIEEAYPLDKVSEEAKLSIARRLFSEKLQSFSVTASGDDDNSKALKLDAISYRITEMKLVEEKGNKFTVWIRYDIQGNGDNRKWMAAFGDAAEDNWVLNKGFDVEVTRCGEKYFISDLSY